MRFIIIGCGSIGKRHIENLISLGHEVAAYNRGAVRRGEVAQRFGIQVFGDLDMALEVWDAEAAIIATPQTLHVEHALIAARRGMHLFIEKPVAHCLDGLSELKTEVAARNLITHVGANMRFHFGPATVRRHIQDGSIGRPLWAFIWAGMHLPDWHPEEDYRQMYSAKKDMGGGAVLDFIHELDLLRWLFGEPERLTAMTRQSGWLDIETEDVVDVLLAYPEGLQVNMHMDYLQRPFQRGIRVMGDKGWVEWDLAAQQVECFEHASGRRNIYPYPNGYGHNDMYVEQMHYFLDCIERGIRSDSDLSVGCRALGLAEQIKESAADNKFKKGGYSC